MTIRNKFNLSIIGDADFSEHSEYDKQMVERILNRMNTIFGMIDKNIDTMEKREGSFYLQNIIFNLSLRLGITKISKEVFLESMSSMYDASQELEDHAKAKRSQ